MLTRVLIVDDEVGFTEMTKLVLCQIGGYDVREVHDSREALGVAKEFHPHVVLLDVMMPGVDGGDVAALLKQDAATRNVPVLFVTALVASEESRPGGMVRNGYRYLPKSVTVEELTECIRESTSEMSTV